MIGYLINNIRVFFTFVYLFFQDYTRILYPFVDSIEERLNLINLALIFEKLPENFGEENPENKEELNSNIETKSNELNNNENNSESFEIIDNTPLIFSEIEKTIINNLDLNGNKDIYVNNISKINKQIEIHEENNVQEENNENSDITEKYEINNDSIVEEKNSLIENEENIEKSNVNKLSEIQEDILLNNKKGRKNKTRIKNKNTFQELEKIVIEKF